MPAMTKSEGKLRAWEKLREIDVEVQRRVIEEGADRWDAYLEVFAERAAVEAERGENRLRFGGMRR